MIKELTINTRQFVIDTADGKIIPDDPYIGELIRENIENHLNVKSLVIDFSGIAYVGPQVLDECFGGLARSGFNPDFIRNKISVIADDDELIDTINNIIETA